MGVNSTNHQWTVVTTLVHDWLVELDRDSYIQVMTALRMLREQGPKLGRPLVDRIKGSELHNLKELRPGSIGRTEVRVLFIFDPRRDAVLLVAGDKSGDWKGWYKKAIPLAEERYRQYEAEREEGEGL